MKTADTVKALRDRLDQLKAALSASDIDAAFSLCGSMDYLLDELQKPNQRGAGRKPNGAAIIDRRIQFEDLRMAGKSMGEIMAIMGISRATYYRYLDFSECQ